MAFLRIENLAVEFGDGGQAVRAVDGLDLDVESGETVAIVGESGSGKSVTSLSILRLLARSARIVSGAIWLGGENLLDKSEREMRDIRGNRVAMIFQEPMSSLNPAYTIGKQIAEPLRIHRNMRGAQARNQAKELLQLVQIAEPERRLGEYPHELSGGMRQRVMIAIALACGPALLIADEPTTALDVTTQAQILDLMRDLKAKLSMAILLVTHDFGVVAELAERVVVMYAGRVVEQGPILEIFDRPQHPYTKALMAARPELGSSFAPLAPARLADIPGIVTVLRADAVGCSFSERCAFATPRCKIETPKLKAATARHRVACHLVAERPQ
jgi:peptide/nickel transport system ATP-binding protein